MAETVDNLIAMALQSDPNLERLVRGLLKAAQLQERARIIAIIDARLMVVEPNDSDVGDELHGRAMELHHLRRTIDRAAPPLRPSK